MQNKLTKSDICQQTQKFGAEFIGFAPAERWREFADLPVNSYPQSFWPQARTVIVFGVPLWLPLVEAAPSVLGREQVIVTNKLLEKIAYRLILLLHQRGYQAVDISGTEFSNVWAGYYAGLGTVGRNHALLTKEYGPRVQLKSVFTELELTGNSVFSENLCTKCGNCQKICPAQALNIDADGNSVVVDSTACLQHEQRLQKAFCDPCGSCLKVCPVGEDRELFQSNNFNKYFAEKDILAKNPQAEEYQDWVHIRNYGSYPLI